ncbi:hypothetical protein BSKO_06789 [Bryopsis sp. KO-2023]|nr:hypothetical protein BSKO_06789 [Bryopsis sp. KO-2023]
MINSASLFVWLDWKACCHDNNVGKRDVRSNPKQQKCLRSRFPINFSEAMCQPRSGGSLLSAVLVVACLATIGLAQSDSAGGSECDAVRAVVGVSARVILDSATLKELDNDVQNLVDCVPSGAALELDLTELVLDDSVQLRSPITIQGNGASVQCPGDQRKGAFQIRCLE